MDGAGPTSALAGKRVSADGPAVSAGSPSHASAISSASAPRALECRAFLMRPSAGVRRRPRRRRSARSGRPTPSRPAPDARQSREAVRPERSSVELEGRRPLGPEAYDSASQCESSRASQTRECSPVDSDCALVTPREGVDTYNRTAGACVKGEATFICVPSAGGAEQRSNDWPQEAPPPTTRRGRAADARARGSGGSAQNGQGASPAGFGRRAVSHGTPP